VAIKNKYPLVINYDDNDNVSGLAEVQLATSDSSDIGGDTPSDGQVLTYISADGVYQPRTPTGGGTPTLPTGDPGDLLINTGGTTYLASAASDAGIMQLDPYFDANDEGAIAQWDGTKLEVKFPDQLYMLVEAGEDLSKGDVVYVTGDTGSGRFIVAKADASDSNKMPAVGLVPEAINNQDNGKIVSFGRAIGLNTFGMTVGKPVYVATTAGGITKDKPTGATDLIQNIGIVSVVDNTNGVIKVTGVGRSNDIPNNLDVVGSATIGTNEFTQTTAKLANVDANHILISDSASATSSTAVTTESIAFLGTQTNLGDLTDVSVVGATAGQSLVYDQDNAWVASTVGTGDGFVDGPTVSATFSSIEVDDLKVTRVGPSRPTSIIKFNDFIVDNVTYDGWGNNLRSGGVLTHLSYHQNTTLNAIGAWALRTNTNAAGGATIHTGDNIFAASTCGVSISARVLVETQFDDSNLGHLVFGFADNSESTSKPTDGVWFTHDENSSNWVAYTGNGANSKSTDTGIAVNTSTYQVLQILCDENWTTFEFYIDGSGVATHLLSTASDYVPTTGVFGIQFKSQNNGSTVDHRLDVDWSNIELTHSNTDRGEGYIKKTLSGE